MEAKKVFKNPEGNSPTAETKQQQGAMI